MNKADGNKTGMKPRAEPSYPNMCGNGNLRDSLGNSQYTERASFIFQANQLKSCRCRDDKPGQLFLLRTSNYVLILPNGTVFLLGNDCFPSSEQGGKG